MQIKHITFLDSQTIESILEIWEAAVRATHDFLEEKDIIFLKPLVKEGIASVEKLIGIYDESGKMCAFMAINDCKIKMLFVDSQLRGKGIGCKLMKYALDNMKTKFVDVNEQNFQAVGFYEHMGFKTFKRSEFDGQGNPFPILHMQIG